MSNLVRFFALCPDMLMAANLRDGLLTYINPAASHALGWSEAELLSRPFLELVHPDDRDEAAAASVPRAPGQTNARLEHRMLRKDGSFFWTEWHTVYFADEELIYGIGRDITRRKQAEAALAAAQAERIAVLESIGDAFYSVDAEWRFTYANARAAALLNQTPGAMLGRRLWDHISKERRAELAPKFALFQQAMKDRQQRDLEHFSETAGRWVSARLYPRDDGGLSVYFQDISERKRMEEALRASQAHFEAVANLVPYLLWRAEPDGTAVWSNQGWLEYVGWPMEALPDGGWGMLHPDDTEKVRTTFEACFLSKRPISQECRVRRHDGVYRWFLARIQPLLDSDGAVAAWFGAATDIDDLKQAQGQQALLIAELQHRTRNLLGIVRSLAAQTLERSASLDAFNSRLKALSRVQSFLSQGSAIGIRELLHAELAAHGIEPTPPRVLLEGPSAELPDGSLQALALGVHELTTNALKHGAFATPSGSLAVRWSIDTEESPTLSLEWRESGVAMPDSYKPARRGFGLELIERSLPYQLGATAKVTFSPDGVACKLVLPLCKAVPQRQPPS